MRTLGGRLRERREAKGLRQEDVAQALHIDKSMVSLYESGKRNPSTPMLKKLAVVLGTSASYLLGETDNPMPDHNDDLGHDTPPVSESDEEKLDRFLVEFARLKGWDAERLAKFKKYIETGLELFDLTVEGSKKGSK